jgi:hypothetical protein
MGPKFSSLVNVREIGWWLELAQGIIEDDISLGRDIR